MSGGFDTVLKIGTCHVLRQANSCGLSSSDSGQGGPITVHSHDMLIYQCSAGAIVHF